MERYFLLLFNRELNSNHELAHSKDNLKEKDSRLSSIGRDTNSAASELKAKYTVNVKHAKCQEEQRFL